MWRNHILFLVLGIIIGLALVSSAPLTTNVPAAQISSPFLFTFNNPGVLKETGSMNESRSPYWWLNSGGELRISGFTGSTMLGNASTASNWRTLYKEHNTVDTDQGLHPQNLFRLVTRSLWDNVRIESKFLVLEDNFSASPNRNSSNGLLLMSRYKDGDTLYYAGIRVDGTAVIKKKYKGTYYTMAQKAVFPGTYQGSQSNLNLIPHKEWISLRDETVTDAHGNVTVRLFMKRDNGGWIKLLEATDRGQYAGTAPIVGGGHTGIRTDFMDVRFESFKAEDL